MHSGDIWVMLTAEALASGCAGGGGIALLKPLTTEAASCGVVLLNALCIADAACALTSSCDTCPDLFRSSGREVKYLGQVESTREEAVKVATTRSDLMHRSNEGERETQLV